MFPLQGAPASDDIENGCEMEFIREVVQEKLCAVDGQIKIKSVRRPAPDPEKEDEVMLERRRFSRIYHRRQFFPYLLEITLGVARRLGFWNVFMIGGSYCKARLFPVKDETYLDAFLINRFGERLYRTFFQQYTEKVWGRPCHQIRADWGAQRIRGLSLKRALVQAVKDLLSGDFKNASQKRETTLITHFFYPKFGPGQMWETVAQQIKSCGGQIYLKHRVIGVTARNSNVASAAVRNVETGETRQVSCTYFFSTMPIKELAKAIRPPLPEEVAAVADGLVYRDFLTVGLLARRLSVREPNKATASVLPDN